MKFMRADVVAATEAMTKQFTYGDRTTRADWTQNQTVIHDAAYALAWSMDRLAEYELPDWFRDNDHNHDEYGILYTWIENAMHDRVRASAVMVS